MGHPVDIHGTLGACTLGLYVEHTIQYYIESYNVYNVHFMTMNCYFTHWGFGNNFIDLEFTDKSPS